ncbi:hypothetical protein C4564_01400 [Candidatus Microgenomates bacterium]|nr:MAG: hypothetical protein C4564_01400 [Candidatus Microgenomates bacterium]
MDHTSLGDFAHILGHYRVTDSYLGSSGKFIVFTQGVQADVTQFVVMFLMDKIDSTLPRQMLVVGCNISADEVGETLEKIFNQHLKCEGCLPEGDGNVPVS